MIATLSAGLAHAERRPEPACAPERPRPVEERLRDIQAQLRAMCLPVDEPIPCLPSETPRTPRLHPEKES